LALHEAAKALIKENKSVKSGSFLSVQIRESELIEIKIELVCVKKIFPLRAVISE